MRAVSLFSGAGGFEIGFDRAGIHTVLQAESDPWCLQVLARHWPHVERVTDVREVNSATLQGRGRDVARAGDSTIVERLRYETGRGSGATGPDLVYGGFPCQDVSVAGQRAGLAGERSGLWFEFRRVLSELRPRWFCAENVPGLLSSNNGRDFGQILSDVDEFGYGVAWAVLDARWFGVPQRRRRVFIVGCLGNANRAAQILAVCESGCGDSAPRSQTREDIAPTLDDGARRASVELPMIAYTLPASNRGTGDGHGNAWNSNYVAATLSGGGHPGSNMPGRHHEDDENLVVEPEARALTARASGYRMDFETENFVVANGLRASDEHHGHSSPRGDGADNLIAFDWQASSGNDDSWRGKGRQHVVRSGDYAGANSATRVDAIAGSFGVRRLTPTECCRLMGWPEDWLRWTADGREIPDSHQYRMAGNGVVSTVAEWIGHRLMAVEAVV